VRPVQEAPMPVAQAVVEAPREEPKPQRKPRKVGKYPKRLRGGDAIGLGVRITKWLLDRGATRAERAIPLPKIAKALSFYRYKGTWPLAIHEMKKRYILKIVNAGVYVLRPENLAKLERRRNRRKAKRPRRPRTKWFEENIIRRDEEEREYDPYADMRPDVAEYFRQQRLQQQPTAEPEVFSEMRPDVAEFFRQQWRQQQSTEEPEQDWRADEEEPQDDRW
jgi:hypothetical protein